ncbi:hypothetical protein ACMSZX_000498 [Cronobacter turicensis]|nr:hypothetical protein [Cronobacter turicensis]
MSEISEKRVEALDSNILECHDVKPSEVKALAGLALLALRERAEPVAYMIGGHYLMHANDPKVDNYSSAVPLYTAPLLAAPPAPVVADERYKHLSDLYHAQEKRLFKLAQRIKGPVFDKYSHSTSQAIDVLEVAIFGENDDACRAAMLQPVSHPYKLPRKEG